MKYTDFEFECPKITGRRFEPVGVHAGYLRDGGCSKIIEHRLLNDLQDKLAPTMGGMVRTVLSRRSISAGSVGIKIHVQ
jgi:hypothetical protein